MLCAIAKKNHNRAPLEGSEPTRKLVSPKGFSKVGPGDCEHFCKCRLAWLAAEFGFQSSDRSRVRGEDLPCLYEWGGTRQRLGPL